jgi:hypothetical protein
MNTELQCLDVRFTSLVQISSADGWRRDVKVTASRLKRRTGSRRESSDLGHSDMGQKDFVFTDVRVVLAVTIRSVH